MTIGALLLSQTIIAPVTLAVDSLEAAATAAAFAAALGAELVLAGITPLVPMDADLMLGNHLPRPLAEQRLLDQLIADRVDELRTALPAGLRARTILLRGSVGAALLEAARTSGAGLIVVPFRQGTDYPDRFVLHHSDVPVLVVPTRGSHASHNAK
jgi:nucleotide-binding universal stress UspA family protein